MPAFVRKHAATVLIALVTTLVAGGSFVWAHNAPSQGHVTLAHNADKVKGLTILPLKKVSTSATEDNDAEGRANAQKVKLYEKGPFQVYGKCWLNDAQPDNHGTTAAVFLQTAEGGTIFSSANGDSSGNSFIGPKTFEEQRHLLSQSSYAGTGSPGTLNITDPEAGGFYAAAASSRVMGDLLLGTKVGTPPTGTGVFGSGNRCIFGGTLTYRG